MFTVRISDVLKFDTHLERRNPLNVYADCRRPRNIEKFGGGNYPEPYERVTRKIQGDNKNKNKKREPSSGVLSSKSNNAPAVRGRFPKTPNFSANRNHIL